MSKKPTVHRHSLTVRLSHWAIALSGLMLTFSGMGELPMYKRYNVTRIPGLSWANDFWLMLDIHYIAAAIFMGAVFYHMVYHVKLRQFAIMPRRGDVGESVQIMKAMLTGGKEPSSGKFLAEQRLAYAAIGAVSLVLILTGLIKAYKNLGPITIEPSILTAITLIHTASTMLFVGLIISHLGAFVIKANRPLIMTIFTGRVDAKYASHRHDLWKPKD